MRLSFRVTALKPSATLAVDARVKELKAAGADIIGFGAGEPDFDTPQPIKQAAIDALLAGRTKYAPTPGDMAARAAIARKLRAENNIPCDDTGRDVIISVGGKHSLYLALQCLLDPSPAGEPPQQVILPTPAWVSYRPMIELAGGEVVEICSIVETDFKVTPEQLAEVITDRTVAFIINSPSNPCGTMYSPDELRALGEVLAKYEHITIITDEIYEKLIYGGVKHFSLGSIPALAKRVVTINGLSKAFAMTGWRIGYACAVGQGRSIINAMATLQGQMTSNITSFCYPAIIEALSSRSEAAVESMRTRFAQRAQRMHGLLTDMPGVRCARPTGAFYVFPDVSAYFNRTSPGGRSIESAMTFAEALLEEAKVAVVPGEDFGGCGGNHVRLGFACSEKDIDEGCARLGRWLQQF